MPSLNTNTNDNDNDKTFVNPTDFAVHSNFEYSRLQFIQLALEVIPHLISTTIKCCGKRWEKVQHSMYEDENGQLRGYKKYVNHRGFRMFIENVF